jgi:Arc/MetJ-type ribon-helix-helix transcriptional regulator
MNVSKTISIPVETLSEIQKRIEKGEETSLSKFIQRAVKNELKR